MKKYSIFVTIIFLLSILSFFEIKDYLNFKMAKQAYFSKDYKKALQYYKNINSDEAKFNQTVIDYRLNDFNQTINELSEFNSAKLEFEKFHNLGNSYANLKKLDEGISAYENALSIKDDNDTKYNLELLKSLKNKEQNNQQKDGNKTNKDKQNKQKDNNKNQNNQDNKNDKNQNDKDKTPKDNMSEKQDQNYDSDDEHDKKDDKKDEKNQNSKKQEENRENSDKKDSKQAKNLSEKPASSIEERKWQKILDNREIGTIMIPFDKKEEDNEKIKPW